MSLNSTPSGERVHIAFFGLRNAGKSSLVNAVTNQALSVVSDIKGTTTDPVKKAMELLPIGPVVIVDTAGIDDDGALGELRVKKSKEVLSSTDIAVLVHDAACCLTDAEQDLIDTFKQKNIPYILAFNKADTVDNVKLNAPNEIAVSATEKNNINELKELIATLAKSRENKSVIVSDLINKGDTVVLVIPVDEAAPKGRLILPQQMTVREILDTDAVAICVQPSELKSTLENLKNPPKFVITDSQAFGEVSKIVPRDLLLTSFSILMARYKGDLETLVSGAKALKDLRDGDRVLISEGCTHHRQCNDIGTVKMPAWIKNFTNASPEFSFTSGGEFPDDLSKYKLVVHCGGCMLNEKEMKSRIERATMQNVPIVNYGVAIALMHGILKRSLEIFPDIANQL